MLATLNDIFLKMRVEAPDHTYVELHSHTPKEQGLFLQKIFDEVQPVTSLEVGLAFGISTLFILEKHREKVSPAGSHIVIEPFPFGGVAEHNLKKEGVLDLADIRYHRSDEVLPRLYYEGRRVQFAYVDTTKLFDTVMQDFYFIDKMLDVNGVFILDDCGGAWPGVQRVARFINTLPHYRVMDRHDRTCLSAKRRVFHKMIGSIVKRVPFKKSVFQTSSFLTDADLGLDYACIAFQKIANDSRNWDWDRRF
jgi:predicted O-methyltransferase YrrM